MPPLRIFFDLADEEKWHRCELERRLSASRPSADAIIVASAGEADAVVRTTSSFHFGPGGHIWRKAKRTQPAHRAEFVWHSGDHPTGREPGLYCSLPRGLFDLRRHRTFSYPWCHNECIDAFDPSEAHTLYGFVGGLSSGLRHRLLRTLSCTARTNECLLRVQSGPWQQMFDRSGVPTKVAYANALRECRFFLCPRGNGVSSIRLFETMQAARVPVIISDAFMPPSDIAWDECSVRVRERDLDSLPAQLRERNADWPHLATNARRAWEQHFSDAALVGSIGRLLRPLLETMRSGYSPTVTNYYCRVAPFWARAVALRVLRRFQQ